ncbi:hypothetical protein PM082_018779 [Marasmius tenuissimus]|nr:hypothetical protein PM082_018779 [Marasmius tenuissimus]
MDCWHPPLSPVVAGLSDNSKLSSPPFNSLILFRVSPLRTIKQPKHLTGQRGHGIHPRAMELYGIRGIIADIKAAAGDP